MANLRVDKITSTETFETTGSVQFDGSGDYLEVDGNGTISAGTGNFTIEGWLYKNAADNGYFFDCRPATGAAAGNPGIYITDTTLKFFVVDTSSHIETEIELNKWVHIALTKESGVYKLWIDGSLKGIHTNSTSVDLVTTTSPILGTRSTLDDTFTLNGFISNFRIVNGKALYTSNFKPPMRELEVIPGTVVLACQSKTDASLEKTGKTISANGNAVASELTPGLLTPIVKSGGGSAITGSVEFDGTGDYLSITESSDFDFGADDFTMEYWYHEGNDERTERRVLYCYDTTQQFMIGHTNDNGGQLFFSAHTSANAQVAGGIQRTASNSNPTGKRNYWRHVAACRDGATFRMFLDGVLQNTTNFGTTAIRGDQNTLYIGQDPNNTTTRNFRGFLSNLRIVKGTALYTDNFIPPTRELKRVPGTVLLCCQDPDNPLTEATGKTITGYGELSQGGGSNLVSNGYNAYSSGDTTGWTTGQSASLSVSSGRLRVTNGTSDYGIAQTSVTTITGQRYLVTADFHAGTGSIGELRASNTSLGNTLGSSNQGHNAISPKTLIFTAASTTTYINVFGSNTNGQYTEWANFSVTLAEGSNKGSNFTPQVGDDRKVTFEGVTKINSDAYFYLPTGDTASREATGTYNAGTRGIFGGGLTPTGSASQAKIQYITISSTGDAQGFGDLTEDRYGNGGLASNTRALWAAGLSSPSSNYYNTIDYVTIASTGNALDFGDITYGVPYYTAGVSNATRGIWGGGYNTPASPQVPSPYPNGFQDEMEYITIASKGNAKDFGDFTARNSHSSFGSPTRGCFAGGATPGKTNSIEYVTIATTGNAQDFGDLTLKRNYGAGCSNATRGLVGGGGAHPAYYNTIDYVTIASTGSAFDFGDLPTARAEIGACSSATRGVFGGAWSPTKIDEMEYVEIATTGNSLTFGELDFTGVYQECGTSNGHGGLG